MDNLFLLRVKATIHLFTYSPFRLLPRSFRRIEPKGYRRVYGRQNWAYVAKNAAGILVDTVLPHLKKALCENPLPLSFLSNSAGTQ